MVKVGTKQTRYVLAVVPGDVRLDMAAVEDLLGGTYAAFADTEKAEALVGSVSGTVLPISYSPDLQLVADPVLLESPEPFSTPRGWTAPWLWIPRTTYASPGPACQDQYSMRATLGPGLTARSHSGPRGG